ncbi:MAG: hypothetical protein ACXADA_05600 [Candidatus Hodarchaeales archaeon]|jgi:hypothetical protein
MSKLVETGEYNKELFSTRNQYIYELTRRGKMYLFNRQRQRLDTRGFMCSLPGELEGLTFRFFFTRFTSEDNHTDLLTNYPEKVLTKAITRGLVMNLQVHVSVLHCDENVYVYDIVVEGKRQESRLHDFAGWLVSTEPAGFASLVEVVATTRDRKVPVILLGYQDGQRQPRVYRQWTMFKQRKKKKRIKQFKPKLVEPPLTHEELKEYHELLEREYQSFFSDVEERACAIWSIPPDWLGPFSIRRYVPFADTREKIIFGSDAKEAMAFLSALNVLQIVPNTLPETMPYPVELLIDADVPRSVGHDKVKLVTDRFDEWLKNAGFEYQRRLTGSTSGGQHFVLPVLWESPWLLAGKPYLWEDYARRPNRKILSDSLRTTGEVLCLAFQLENPDLAKIVTTRVFDKHSRYRRILLDTTPNSVNKGRRSILSMHQATGNLCVPMTGDFPDSREALEAMTSLETVKELGISSFKGWKRTGRAKRINTSLLAEITSEYEQIFIEFTTTTKQRFEEHWLDLPVPGLETRARNAERQGQVS